MQAENDNGNLPITNTLFPPPPPYYTAYTVVNLAAAAGAEDNGSAANSEGSELRVLEKPRVDWIREEGRWMSFGQMYSVRSSGVLTDLSLTSS